MRSFILLAALATAGCGDRGHEPGHYVAIDGDTIRTGRSPNIRLARIDAPELAGHCRPGRRCIEGDPFLARQTLQEILDTSSGIVCVTSDMDVYGRRIAECTTAGGLNISSEMLRTGTVGLYAPPLSFQGEGR
jgi:endonuclease YncB( thermonuclease family)